MNNGTLPEHMDKLSDDGGTVVFLLGCKCCWILHAHSYLTTEIALTSYLFLGKKEDKKGGQEALTLTSDIFIGITSFTLQNNNIRYK